jgi:S-adenosylmethionine decarboxylase
VRDLAPGITRQRLLVEGFYEAAVDQAMITRFLDTLTRALDLRMYGEPTIFSPGGTGREENQGYDAFVPLIDSGLSLYVWTASRFLALVVFTCKRFDAARAIEVTREAFAMTEVESREF